jgi:hypothetical protein
MPQLTNGERAALIDALKWASAMLHSIVDCNLPKDPKDDEPDDAEERALRTAQIKRYRKLRRRLLAEEQRA